MNENKYTHDVFISFSFKDQTLAENIVNILSSTYGISCWICTRDIDGGKRYKKLIPEAIDNAKVIVFLQSSSSIESKEIPKEIGMAFDADKTIIPFKLDDAKLTGDLRYDLYGVEYIDATVPTFDERVNELAKAIKKVIADESTDSYVSEAGIQTLVSTPNVLPKTVFCGRDDILSEIYEKYQDGERVLFLHGIGGIGKTQIAKQYAKQHKKDYDTIIYATYNGSLKDLIISDEPFAIKPALVRYTLSDGRQEDDAGYLARKIELLNKLSNERTLIIIDNFDVEEDEYLPMLMNGRYHLLITTRCDYSRFYPTITINPIDSVDAIKEIFMKNYCGDSVDEDDPALIELIELVNRHTYTIELLAQHMENSDQTPSEMIIALKDRGIMSMDEEVRNSNMKSQIAYENLLKMFHIFSLNAEDRQVLMYLSLMPIEGVNVKDFKKWANLNSSRTIKSLENRSWVIRNTEGITLHSIIRSVIKHEIPITEDNCLDFIHNFNQSIGEKVAWHLSKKEKDRLGAIGKSILDSITTITEKTEELFFNVENVAAFGADPQYAEVLASKLYDYYLRVEGEKSFKAGRSAFKLGWLYAFNSYLPEARQKALLWLEKADEILSGIELHTSTERSPLTQTRVNLAKLYLLQYVDTNDIDDYLKAKNYAEQAIALTEKYFLPGDIQYTKVAGAHWQLADVLLAGGEVSAALEHINTSLDILLPLYTENDGDSMHALNRKAAVLFAAGAYIEARQLAEKSVKGYADFFGENHPLVVGMYTLLGDCCEALGEYTEAKAAYERALEIAESLYAPGAKQILDLKAKV